jgi:hypothetical protein
MCKIKLIFIWAHILSSSIYWGKQGGTQMLWFRASWKQQWCVLQTAWGHTRTVPMKGLVLLLNIASW